MRTTAIVRVAFLFISLICLIIQVYECYPVLQTVIIVSFIILNILSVLQMIITHGRFKKYWFLHEFNAISLLLQGLCFIAFIFAYQEYEDWQYVLLGAFSLYLVLFALMIVYIKTLWVAKLRTYFVMNLLLPGLFIILYSLVPTLMTGKNYYETFNKQRYHKSWEQYNKQTEETDSITVRPY